MIETSAFYSRTQVSGTASPGRTAGGKSDSSPTDAFSAIFQKATGGAEAYRLKPAENAQSAETPESPPLMEKPEDENLPDEMSALAGKVVVQEVQTTAAPQQNDSDQVKIVSSLEGNKDIVAQPPGSAEKPAAPPAVGQEEITDEELMARMPKEQGQPNKTQEKADGVKGETVASTQSGGSCPLENENESTQSNRQNQPNLSNQQNQNAAPGQNKGRVEAGAAKEVKAFEDAPRVFDAQQQQIDITPERIAGAERLAAGANLQQAAPVLSTATTETLFNTMVQDIEMSALEELKYMEIQLKPEFLGKVSIRLALADGGLEIRIKAADTGVKNLIAGQISQLSETLSEKGVKVTTIDVVQADVSEHAFGQSGSKNRQQGRATYDGYNDNSSFGIGLGFTEEETVSMVDAGLSSVEYRA